MLPVARIRLEAAGLYGGGGADGVGNRRQPRVGPLLWQLGVRLGEPHLGLPRRPEPRLLFRRPHRRPTPLARPAQLDLRPGLATDLPAWRSCAGIVRGAGRRRTGRAKRPAGRLDAALPAAERGHGNGLALCHSAGNPVGRLGRQDFRHPLCAFHGGQHRGNALDDLRAGSADRRVGHSQGIGTGPVAGFASHLAVLESRAGAGRRRACWRC